MGEIRHKRALTSTESHSKTTTAKVAHLLHGGDDVRRSWVMGEGQGEGGGEDGHHKDTKELASGTIRTP